VASSDGHGRPALQLSRDERGGWRREDRGHRGEVIGRPGAHLGEGPEHLLGTFDREQHQAAHDRRDRVDTERHRGHHPEVAPAAAESPQQLGVIGLAGMHQLAVRCDDVGGQQVIAREPMPAHQPAQTTRLERRSSRGS
jgi:hypothetical protein